MQYSILVDENVYVQVFAVLYTWTHTISHSDIIIFVFNAYSSLYFLMLKL